MTKIELDPNIVKINKIPILLYIPEWLQHFTGKMDEEMEAAKKALEDVFQREKDLEREIAEKDGRKRTLMRKILYVSREINDAGTPGADLVMDDTEQELAEINEAIPLLMEELENIPNMVNEKNTELLKASIARGFELIMIYKAECEEYQEEVNALRGRLAELIKLKVDTQGSAQKLYYILHSWIGKKEMEKLDHSHLAEFVKGPSL